MIISQISNQVATFVNVLDGIASLVTKVSKGYAVTLIDTDAEQVVTTRIYPPTMFDQAVAYAKKLANT
jgi:hypothetical protein